MAQGRLLYKGSGRLTIVLQSAIVRYNVTRWCNSRGVINGLLDGHEALWDGVILVQ